MATGQHHIIKETTDTLVDLLTETFKEAGYKRVHIIVEAPKPEAIEGKQPAVCLYMYQVSPDWEGVALADEYVHSARYVNEKGRVVEVKQDPPAWVRLDYVISTWAQTPEDEQLLMGLSIKCLTEVKTLSGDKLKGESFPHEYELPLMLHGRMDEGTQARFWGSLNQPIRPALSMFTIVPIMSDIMTPFRRVEERLIAFRNVNERKGQSEIGPEGTPDVPPDGQFVKRTK
jgi:uncharacterized protein DUF4255